MSDSSPTGAPLSLPEIRSRIDALDEQLAQLLEARAQLMDDVLRAKAASSALSVRDPQREREILDRLSLPRGRFPPEAMRAIFREVINACVALQEREQVIFLGPEGSFTHVAARLLFGTSAAYREATTIQVVFDSLTRGEAALGVIPVENTHDGVIASALDALLQHPLQIRHEIVMELHHALVSRTLRLDQITQVFGTAQTLAQCGAWLSENLPAAERVQVAAAAVIREAASNPKAAAIASRAAAERFDVPVVADQIEDRPSRSARYFVVGKEADPRAPHERSTVAVWPNASSPAEAFRAFAQHGIEVLRVHSRPLRSTPWAYVYLFDLGGASNEPGIAAALEALRASSREVKVLGSYPVLADH